MAQLGNACSKAREGIDRIKLYPVDEAVKLVMERANAKFDETVEIAMNLGVDPKHADQMVRGVVNLPNGTGRSCVWRCSRAAPRPTRPRRQGPMSSARRTWLRAVQGGTIAFDRCIATPDMMPLVGRLGKVLGPRGLMPNPKVGTVTMDISGAVKASKGGAVEFRVEKAGIIQGSVGKASFAQEKLVENIAAFVDAVAKAKPSGRQGHLSSTCRDFLDHGSWGQGRSCDAYGLNRSVAIARNIVCASGLGIGRSFGLNRRLGAEIGNCGPGIHEVSAMAGVGEFGFRRRGVS